MPVRQAVHRRYQVDESAEGAGIVAPGVQRADEGRLPVDRVEGRRLTGTPDIGVSIMIRHTRSASMRAASNCRSAGVYACPVRSTTSIESGGQVDDHVPIGALLAALDPRP